MNFKNALWHTEYSGKKCDGIFRELRYRDIVCDECGKSLKDMIMPETVGLLQRFFEDNGIIVNINVTCKYSKTRYYLYDVCVDGEIISLISNFTKRDDAEKAGFLKAIETIFTHRCPGIEIAPGDFSGCDKSAGDCPICGG